MAEAIVAVEAYHDEQDRWILVKSLIGDQDDMTEEAEAIKADWLKAGWPAADIRIVVTKFKSLSRRPKLEEDD